MHEDRLQSEHPLWGNPLGLMPRMHTTLPSPTPPDAGDMHSFIDRWRAARRQRAANCPLFVTELCALLCMLELEPDPERDDGRDNGYVFERRVGFAHGAGSLSAGFTDRYRCVLEAMRLKTGRQAGRIKDGLLQTSRSPMAAPGRPQVATNGCFKDAKPKRVGVARRTASEKRVGRQWVERGSSRSRPE